MVSVRVSLNLKEGKKIFPQETMAAGENRFAPELNEKEVVELFENATPGSMEKAWKLYFDNLKQCKLRQFIHLKMICTLPIEFLLTM